MKLVGLVLSLSLFVCAQSVFARTTVDYRLADVLKKFNECEEAVQRFAQAEKIKDLHIMKGDRRICPTGASFTLKVKNGIASKFMIHIDIEDSFDLKVGHLLFELGNVVTYEKFIEIRQRAEKGLLSREEFTQESERVEFEVMKESYKIAKACIASGKWNEASNFGSNDAIGSMSFPEFWDFLKDLDHPELYRKQWDASYADAYHKHQDSL